MGKSVGGFKKLSLQCCPPPHAAAVVVVVAVLSSSSDAAAEVRLPKGSASAAKLATATAATDALPLPTPPPLCYHRQCRTLAKLLPPLPSWLPPPCCRRASAAGATIASQGKDHNHRAVDAMPTATTAATLPASCRRCWYGASQCGAKSRKT